MESAQSINKLVANLSVPLTAKSVSGGTSTPGEFDTTLKAFLTPNKSNKVSEEELFSALVQERIKKTKGESALTDFKTLFESAKKRLQKPNGSVSAEDAAKEALKEYRDSNKITKEEADSIYSQAFAAAQLDQNRDALYDDRGGPNDPTMAVAEMEQALLLSGAMMSKFDSGGTQVTARSLDEASNTAPQTSTNAAGANNGAHSEGGSGGFLFKPASDSDGKLAVLLPSTLAGLVSGVALVDPTGKVIETARYTGNGNGGRDHFRFSRVGGDYQDGIAVQATLKTGEIIRYIIKETSQRTENVQPESAVKS